MAQPNISHLNAIAKSDAVKSAVQSALLSLSSELLQENPTAFPVKAQAKRYALARQIISGDTTPAVQVGLQLLTATPLYFDTVPDSNVIKSDMQALNVAGYPLVQFLAGVSALDLI